MKIRSNILIVILLASVLPSLAQLHVKIRGSDKEVCYGSTIQLEDSIVLGAPLGYLWTSDVATFSNGTRASTARTTKAVLNESGYVYLKTNGGGNTSLDSIYVTVKTLPTIDIVDLPWPNNVFCENDADFPLFASPSGGVWSASDPSTVLNGKKFSPAKASVFNEDISIRYTYVSPATGCMGSDSINLRVAKSPVLSVPNDTTLCREENTDDRLVVFDISADNASHIYWGVYDNSQRVQLGDAKDGDANFSFDNATDIDTFTFYVSAVSQSSGCPDVSAFFSVRFVPEEGCLTNVYDSSIDHVNVYPNPNTGTFTVDNIILFDVDVYGVR